MYWIMTLAAKWEVEVAKQQILRTLLETSRHASYVQCGRLVSISRRDVCFKPFFVYVFDERIIKWTYNKEIDEDEN